MFENEYILRLIKDLARTATALFCGKDSVKSGIDIEDNNVIFSEDELLEFLIKKHLNEGKVNEAENMLFEALRNRRTAKNLETAMLFYEELINWDEDKLLSCNFSKFEIQQGLMEVKRIFM